MSQVYKSRAQFQSSTPLEKRKSDFAVVREKYPGTVTIYVDTDDKNSFELSKNKFIVPENMTAGQFMMSVRSKMKKLKPTESLTAMAVNKKVTVQVTMSKTMSSIFDEYKDEDGCLYMTIVGENTFGC